MFVSKNLIIPLGREKKKEYCQAQCVLVPSNRTFVLIKFIFSDILNEGDGHSVIMYNMK